MRTKEFGAVVSAALMLLLGSVVCYAAERAPGKGSISGTVKDGNGKPVVGLQLRLEVDDPVGARRGSGKGGTRIVARATTDQNGNFSFTDLEPGNYRLVAGSKQQGWIYQDVEVRADDQTKLGDLKLTKVN
jgi:protocatechuate 3,4-dioxygenase beta subunit